MTTRPHHVDIVEGTKVVKVSFAERMRIQMEMIQDHAYFIHADMETAVWNWVQSGLAKDFADHYQI